MSRPIADHSTAGAHAAARPGGGHVVRRLTASVTISALGTWSYNVGIAVYAYQETGSTAWVAAATVGRYVPAVGLTWVGTWWADRYPRRRVAVLCDLACAVAMTVLTIVALLHGPLILAIALAAASSGIARIQGAAALALAADVIVESRLMRSMALINSAEAVSTAIGPALAAIILATSGPPVLFAINAVTFFASALLLSGLRSPEATRTTPGRLTTSLDRAVLRGVWPLLTLRALVAVVYGADVVLLAVVATQQLNEGPSGYGWLLACACVGGILVAIGLRRTRRAWTITASASTGIALYALPLLAFLATPALSGGMAVQVLRGMGAVLATTALVTALQRSVPSASAGPLFGFTHAIVLLGTCAGALLAPICLALVGLTGSLIVLATLPMLGLLILTPALRSFDRHEHALVATLDPKVSLLRGLSLFAEARRSTLIDLAEHATEAPAPAGTPIVRQGDESTALYVLVEGSVEVSVVRADGPVVLRHMDSPTFFGEIGLVHGIPRTATVTAVDDAVVWRIPADRFLDAVSQAGLSSALTDGVTRRVNRSAAAGAPVDPGR